MEKQIVWSFCAHPFPRIVFLSKFGKAWKEGEKHLVEKFAPNFEPNERKRKKLDEGKTKKNLLNNKIIFFLVSIKWIFFFARPSAIDIYLTFKKLKDCEKEYKKRQKIPKISLKNLLEIQMNLPPMLNFKLHYYELFQNNWANVKSFKLYASPVSFVVHH